MGRPAKFDRDAAIAVVMEEIWQRGFEACSVKALSERLGITRSSFYNAFSSREALFREVLARYVAASPDHALLAAAEATAVKPLITKTFRQICRVRAADPQGRGCLLVNCVSELCNGHDALAPMLRDGVSARRAQLEHLLSGARERGELAPDVDPRALALALQSLLAGINVLSKVVRDEASLWTIASTTLAGLGLLDEATAAEEAAKSL